MKNDIRMIVTDLDQTFLKTDKSISGYSVDVIQRCKKAGILIAVATARSTISAINYINTIQPDIIISNGGALAKKGSDVLYRCVLSADTTGRFTRKYVDDGEFGRLIIETDADLYCNDRELAKERDYDHAKYFDFKAPLLKEAYKINAEFPNLDLALAFAEDFKECSMIPYNGETLYRFAEKDATKLHAVKAAGESLGISMKEVAAFGDDYNDVDMIRESGIGIAMENAVEPALKSADFITRTNDADGVAYFIEKHILS